MRAALFAAFAALALIAAAPAAPPKPVLPKVPLHTEFVVSVNKLGQVTNVLSGKLSKDRGYNVQTYGNAQQVFIRTPDDHALAGRYRLSYDYDPKTLRIHRGVTLLRAGGVDPNAEGLALKMLDDARKHDLQAAAAASPQAARTPGPAFTGKLPDLQDILKTPPP
jgi:hypothetical protein